MSEQFPLQENQTDHWPKDGNCKCGWSSAGEQTLESTSESRLSEHVHEEQMEEIDRSWGSY
jgi:hypothetical protein